MILDEVLDELGVPADQAPPRTNPTPEGFDFAGADLPPLLDRLPSFVRRRMDEEVGDDRSRQAHALVGVCVELGLADSDVLAIAARHRPTIEKYGRSLAVEVARSASKFRQAHDHIGRSCTDAGCANAPSWMAASDPSRLAGDGARTHADGDLPGDDGEHHGDAAPPRVAHESGALYVGRDGLDVLAVVGHVDSCGPIATGIDGRLWSYRYGVWTPDGAGEVGRRVRS